MIVMLETYPNMLEFVNCGAIIFTMSFMKYLVISSLAVLSFDGADFEFVQRVNIHSFVFSSLGPCSIVLLLMWT